MARQADQPPEPPPVTAEEWLAAHDAEAIAEDLHRKITDEYDLAEVADRRASDQQEVGHGKPLTQSPEPDIRERANNESTAERSQAGKRAADEVRIPNADETAESVHRAQRALQELKHRQASEARHAEDEAREETSRWQANQESATDHEAGSGPVSHHDGHEAFVLDAYV